MKICIIGAGNAGCAHAFKFTENGHSISLLKTSHAMHDENFEEIRKNGGIWCIDHTNNNKKSFQKLSCITRDWDEALSNAEIAIIHTQSNQHEVIAKKIALHLTDSIRLIFIIPGNMGSVYFRQNIDRNDVIYAEGESTPFDARIIEPGVVNILFKNIRNAVAFTPNTSDFKKTGMGIIGQLIDTYGYFRSNIVESALHNPNLVVHCVGTIMSASRIEYTGGEFWMYREAFTPAIWNLIKQLDDEKNKVIKEFDGEPMSYLDACKFRNELDLTKDSLAVFKSYGDDGGPKGPKSINGRYLFEDVPMGLVLLSSLAKKTHIATPVCDALITIASSLVLTDFMNIGRTLENLNLSEKSLDDLFLFLTK